MTNKIRLSSPLRIAANSWSRTCLLAKAFHQAETRYELALTSTIGPLVVNVIPTPPSIFFLTTAVVIF